MVSDWLSACCCSPNQHNLKDYLNYNHNDHVLIDIDYIDYFNYSDCSCCERDFIIGMSETLKYFSWYFEFGYPDISE